MEVEPRRYFAEARDAQKGATKRELSDWWHAGISMKICVNSGVFINERDTSRFDIGLLDKEAVLEAKNQVAVMDKDTYEDSVVGGSIEILGCIHKHMKLNFNKAS